MDFQRASGAENTTPSSPSQTPSAESDAIVADVKNEAPITAMATNPDIRKVLADIANEEKTHLAEFETMLLRMDKEQVQENEKGRKEVEELTKKEIYKSLEERIPVKDVKFGAARPEQKFETEHAQISEASLVSWLRENPIHTGGAPAADGSTSISGRRCVRAVRRHCMNPRMAMLKSCAGPVFLRNELSGTTRRSVFAAKN